MKDYETVETVNQKGIHHPHEHRAAAKRFRWKSHGVNEKMAWLFNQTPLFCQQ